MVDNICMLFEEQVNVRLTLSEKSTFKGCKFALYVFFVLIKVAYLMEWYQFWDIFDFFGVIWQEFQRTLYMFHVNNWC